LGPFFDTLFWRVFSGVNIIELDNCFVQSQAILTIAIDRAYYPGDYKLLFPDVPEEEDRWGWLHVINVFLLHQEKRILLFENAASRDKRFAEIVEQMKEA
jgi:hypothetical protein